jgi:hypothetical protein
MSLIFSRERLEAALSEGGITADEETIQDLDKWLYALQTICHLTPPSEILTSAGRYRYIKTIECHEPSKELSDLHKALHNWINSDFENKEMESDVLYGLIPPWALEILHIKVSEAVNILKSAVSTTRIEAERNLLSYLHRKYIVLSGNHKLGNDGPGVRFIRACASILGVPAPQGIRQRLDYHDRKRKKGVLGSTARPANNYVQNDREV